MEDEKTKDINVSSDSLQPSLVSSPNKVDVENAPQDVDVETAPQGVENQTSQILETKSDPHFDISEEATLKEQDEEAVGGQSSRGKSDDDASSEGPLQESGGGNSCSSVVAQQDDASKIPLQEPVGEDSSTSVVAQPDDDASKIPLQEPVGEDSSTSVAAPSDNASHGPLLDVIQEPVGPNSPTSQTHASQGSLVDEKQESVWENSSTSVVDKPDEASLLDVKQESVGGNSSTSVADEASKGPLIQPQIEAKKKILTASYSSPEIKIKDSSLPQGKDVKDANVSPLPLSKKEAIIDTTNPIASVKHAVSRFGGIVDWKAHKAHTMERRKYIQLELDKAHEEIPVFKRLREVAEEEKIQVMKKLSSSKRLNEELKLNLERAQLEEQQAKQDSELAILRMEELEQGIADEVSKAAKAQLEVARARLAAAVSELKTVQDELQQLQQDFTSLEADKASAISKANESVAESKQVEKHLEDLSIQLINTKDSLETAQASHLEAEEQRSEKISAIEQDVLKFEMEMKAAEEELERLTNKFSSGENVKAQLVTSLASLQKLKGELGAYMEPNLDKENLQEENLQEENLDNKNRGDMEAAVASAKMELEETRANIKKVMDEVNFLKESASSLEAELNKIKSEIAVMQENEVNVPEKLQHATEDTNPAKLLVELRGEEYKKAKEEATHAKNEKTTIEHRLLTTQKELDVAKACEKSGLDAIKELQESESSDTINEDSQTEVTLSLEEYYGLNMQAHEAEEDANKKVVASLSQIDAAKESELDSINKLNEANNEIEQIKKELEIALQKANIAIEGKFNAEEELRKWRADQQIQKDDHGNVVVPAETSGNTSESATSVDSNPGPEEKLTKKKKRSIIPRIFMFMGKKKSSSKPS